MSKSRVGSFTKEDVEICWPHAIDYLVEILNEDYPLDSAQNDLSSLIWSKFDSRVTGDKP